VIGGRKANGEDRSGSIRSVEPDARPQSFCGTPADVEAHPDTTDSPCVRLIDLVETVEDPVSLVGIDPRPSVLYSDDDIIGVDADRDLDPLVLGGVLQRVIDEVAHDPIDVFLDTKDQRYRI
jgi:hypothetical protein